MQDRQIAMSIVIPCFNEAESISNLFSKLRQFEEKLSKSHELIFVDDGSTDATYSKLKEFYNDRIGKDAKVIRHPKNRGVGAALKTGILDSDGCYIAAMDSDCTYEPINFIDMLRILKREQADMITASPYHPEGSVDNVPLYRLFLSINLSRIYNIVLRCKFYTYTSIFRIYRAEAVKSTDFKSDGFLSMAEIFIRMHQKGYRILEYPTTLMVRKFGTSKAKILKVIIEHLHFIVKLLTKKGRKV